LLLTYTLLVTEQRAALSNAHLSNAQLDARALRHVAQSQITRILTWRADYAATGAVPAVLTTLDISRMPWNESTEWIPWMCRGLVSLDLSHVSIDSPRCAVLRGSLHRCANLRDLVLHHNTIDAAAASALLETLEGLTTARTTVDLAENELTPMEREELFAGLAKVPSVAAPRRSYIPHRSFHRQFLWMR
jgi:hypothetical protein